ncbi:MAG TPA: hypothetical protein VI981_02165 [Candidatus Paceibacterota bacterium]|uniref:Uncharacterized protein n=1 Tax=Candidatus Sungbacteria bacterium RIFCSPHIGHO2_01_FULL_47_32 TaxID=1802264 RepID=A0A1G2K7E8_9BACT|nr:MAG: hypothetical protein UX72_C0051G0006 [Parcubacteria group bacterium GW2011_GWA2_47_10]OGZ95374.1 MAG: hypothetical protein A2633_04295 [Candidatus Sungbacteria bacterium RIFCSPHIGHO2_01_FULL_47_32]OGZ98871.1 MAG: hypothetical protein A3D57_03950 [Candidatus Sungbacteria bacterium RIFCSPHIGHO2_02_FULL_46_12]OHA05230.1 MAG: hypothetical protein A3A28_04155 [Candidatus Sungbacteria bacterium RIFCSPLOWO2_01_FULL_47_32]
MSQEAQKPEPKFERGKDKVVSGYRRHILTEVAQKNHERADLLEKKRKILEKLSPVERDMLEKIDMELNALRKEE